MIYYNIVFLLLCWAAFCVGDQFEEECGLEEESLADRVWEGQGVEANAFPWHVAIFRKKGDGFEYICGGSIVRKEVVLSAAHCFSDQTHNHQVTVDDYRIVGGIRLSSWNSTEIGRQEMEVRAVRLGDDYGGSVRNYQDDIAVVHLRSTFTFTATVRAICLDLVDRDLYIRHTSPGSVGKVAGWGFTELLKASLNLNFLNVPVVGPVECIQGLPSSYTSFITSDKICAGLSNGTAVCPGDSGGGLVFSLQNTSMSSPRWYLYAILSNAPTSSDLSNPCRTNVLALYTNVFKHRYWLYTNLEDVQPQGSGCRVRGSPGVCRNFSACPAAIEAATRGILPQSCSPSSSEICCMESGCPPLPASTVSQQKTGSKANDYCVDLAEILFPCQQNGSNWSRGDICGFNPDQISQGNFMVPLAKASGTEVQSYALLQYGSTMAIAVFLVSDRWILAKATDLEAIQRTPGQDITSTPEAVFSVIRTVYLPQYESSNTTLADNIGLMEMDKPVSFSRSLRPVCLPLRDPLPLAVLDLTVRWWAGVGYGWYQFPADPLSQEACSQLFSPGSTGVPDGVTDKHMCITTRAGDVRCRTGHWYHATARNGHRVACTQLLTGLYLDHSHKEGENCKQLFLRVAPYVPWIESYVWR